MSCSLFFCYHSNYLNSSSFRYFFYKKSAHKINSKTIDRCLKYNQPIRIFSLPMISDNKKKKRTNRIPKPSSIFFLMKKPISDKHYLIFFRKFHLALNPYDSLVAKLYLPILKLGCKINIMVLAIWNVQLRIVFIWLKLEK